MDDRKVTPFTSGTEADSARLPYEAPALRVVTEEEILAQLGPGQLYTGALPFDF
jgi:hypothetical protein